MQKDVFLDKMMFAMSGGPRSHNLIASNIDRAIGNQLEGGPCVVYTSDMRVKVQADGLYTVSGCFCGLRRGEFANEQDDTLLNPTILVEILSDSREAADRGKKFGLCRQIPSLRGYLLVSQHKPLVEQYIRQDNGEWLLRAVAGLGRTDLLILRGYHYRDGQSILQCPVRPCSRTPEKQDGCSYCL